MYEPSAECCSCMIMCSTHAHDINCWPCIIYYAWGSDSALDVYYIVIGNNYWAKSWHISTIYCKKKWISHKLSSVRKNTRFRMRWAIIIIIIIILLLLCHGSALSHVNIDLWSNICLCNKQNLMSNLLCSPSWTIGNCNDAMRLVTR